MESDHKQLRDFNELLAESIKETIRNVLGSKTYDALALNMSRFHNVGPEEIPYRLDTLDSVLRQHFGSGFAVLEKAIVKQFYSKIGMEFVEQHGYTFQDYIETAKHHLTTVS